MVSIWVRYAAVDDVGHAINPMVVDGQTHGGAAQGIGQALCELCAYDLQGQLLSASFMDYAAPRASDIANLPRAFGHSADTRILQFAVLSPKYLILLVGAKDLEPWTR